MLKGQVKNLSLHNTYGEISLFPCDPEMGNNLYFYCFYFYSALFFRSEPF